MSLFLLQLRGELQKLLGRKRTYLGFGVFIVVEILLLFLLNLPRVQRPLLRVMEEMGYPAGLSGLTLAFLVLLWSVFLLGSLYLALVSGDIVSKEVEEGTLRMLLCRPVARERLLTLKAITLILYTLGLCWFISLTALGAGVLQGGTGPLFVFAPTEKVTAFFDFAPGLGRYFLATALLSLCLLTIPALGFFLSCLEMKPAAATIATLSYFFLDSILKNIPFFESIRGWFITSHMSVWVHGLQPVIPWARLAESLTLLLAVNLSLFLLARVLFAQRDFKS